MTEQETTDIDCPICGQNAKEFPRVGDFKAIYCFRCGPYRISESVLPILPSLLNGKIEKKARLSHAI